MTKAEQAIRELSEMYDIYMAFRQARAEAGIPMESPIAGMTPEEFEELRRSYLKEQRDPTDASRNE